MTVMRFEPARRPLIKVRPDRVEPAPVSRTTPAAGACGVLAESAVHAESAAARASAAAAMTAAAR